MTTRSDNIFVVRRFERDDGVAVLEVERPNPYPDDRYDIDNANAPWRCNFTIRFPDGETLNDHIVGIDGIQAMLLALRHAAFRLTHVADGTPAKRPQIRWLGEDDLGLTLNNFN